MNSDPIHILGVRDNLGVVKNMIKILRRGGNRGVLWVVDTFFRLKWLSKSRISIWLCVHVSKFDYKTIHIALN